MSMSAQLDCYGGQAKQMSVFANLTFSSSDLQVLMSIGVHYLIWVHQEYHALRIPFFKVFIIVPDVVSLSWSISLKLE